MEGKWSRYIGGQFIQWSCYRGSHFNGGRMVMEVASSKEGEWFCYSGGQFNGGRIFMLRRRPV